MNKKQRDEIAAKGAALRKNSKIAKSLIFDVETLEKIERQIRWRWKYTRQQPVDDSFWPLVFRIDYRSDLAAQLFERFGLDEKDPIHWRALIEAFCLHYATSKTKPKQWHSETFARLGEDLIELWESNGRAELTDTAATRLLLSDRKYKARYRSIHEDRLRHLVADVKRVIGPMDDEARWRLDIAFPQHHRDDLPWTSIGRSRIQRRS